jgi:hypothetical protein
MVCSGAGTETRKDDVLLETLRVLLRSSAAIPTMMKHQQAGSTPARAILMCARTAVRAPLHVAAGLFVHLF